MEYNITFGERRNKKWQLVGKTDDNRLEYRVMQDVITVAPYEKDRFEYTINNYLNASDKYYAYKANHSIIGAIRSIAQIGLLFGGGFAGFVLPKKMLKNKNFGSTANILASIGGCLAGIVVGSGIGRQLTTPGFNDMKKNERLLKTMDASFKVQK